MDDRMKYEEYEELVVEIAKDFTKLSNSIHRLLEGYEALEEEINKLKLKKKHT